MKAKKPVKGKGSGSEYMKDVPPEKSFWVSNGWVVRNLGELKTALEQMNDETFAYHLNKEKNDFSKWIREVVGDKKLAFIFQRVKSKPSAMEVMKRRLRQLK